MKKSLMLHMFLLLILMLVVTGFITESSAALSSGQYGRGGIQSAAGGILQTQESNNLLSSMESWENLRKAGQEAGDLLRSQSGNRSGVASAETFSNQGLLPGLVSLFLLLCWFVLLWLKARDLRILQRSAVIGGLAVLLAWGASRLALVIPGWQNQQQIVPLGYLTLLILATGLAVWLTAKRLAMPWPDPLWAMLPAATFLALYRVWPSFWSSEKNWLNVYWYARDFFLQTGVFSAGAFLFPVLPRVRGSRVPSIQSRKVVLAAWLSAFAVLAAETLFSRINGGLTPFLGLITLVIGGFSAVAAIGLAILLTIARRERGGAVVGLWGILFWLGIWLLWMILGAPWFP
jgi:hypothetical protein